MFEVPISLIHPKRVRGPLCLWRPQELYGSINLQDLYLNHKGLYQDPPVGVSNGLPHTTYRLPDRAPLGGSRYIRPQKQIPPSDASILSCPHWGADPLPVFAVPHLTPLPLLRLIPRHLLGAKATSVKLGVSARSLTHCLCLEL